MVTLPFKVGIKSTLRLINHDITPEGWIAKNAKGNYGYIWCVVVDESARGKGNCRLLIDHAIADMREQEINEFWLKTEDPKNVSIYQKLGFKLAYETVVKSSGLKSWVMRKN